MRGQALTWRRLAGVPLTVAVALASVAAAAETAAATVAGRVAAGPTVTLVVALAVLLIGSAGLDMIGRVLFSGVVGRAEGRLRGDLLEAATAQPITVLEDQAVGELIDRVDDDTRQLAHLFRRAGWETGRAVLRSLLGWVVAGFVWWPAWIAFPLVAVLVVLVAKPLTARIARCKAEEEAAWSDHSAQLEEAVAGQDDVRTALGQSHVVRAYSARAHAVLERVRRTCRVSTTVGLRTGFLVHALLAGVALAGVAVVSGGGAGVAELVTLWLLVTAFVGQVDQIVDRMPEIQAGLGALARVGTLLSAEREPDGGHPVPEGQADVRLDGLTAGYPGGFHLAGIDLTVAAGTTCALVGRTGSGKSTVVRVLSRAVEPPPGQVYVGGRDVTTIALDELRRAVGVVTQRTEILAATLADNVTLFADVPRSRVEAAVRALGLEEWVDALPHGLNTRLGAAGVTLSAGEEQLVAFARLLVRDVAVVVLDEATARMDPQTEERVTRAASALLAGRTGILVAHRLSTVRRADTVAVLDGGRVVQQGPHAELATRPGRFADLLAAAGDAPAEAPEPAPLRRAARRPVAPAEPGPSPRLWRAVLALLAAHPRWGVFGGLMFTLATIGGATGAVTGWLWGVVVGALQTGARPWGSALLLAGVLLLFPMWIAFAFRTYPLWWSALSLRMRLAVLRGQTMQHRLARTPPGEVVARALDSDRLVLYADRWVDVCNGVIVVGVTWLVSGDARAAAVIGAALVLCAMTSAAGAPFAGRAGRAAAEARARFGTSLGSALEAVRTVKLAAAAGPVRAHLADVDRHRVRAAIREQSVRAVLDGVPGIVVQSAVVLAWSLHLRGTWDLPTALLVTTALSGAVFLGQVFGAAVTEAPIARRWLAAVAPLAGTSRLTALPSGVDLVTGAAPDPDVPPREPLHLLSLDKMTAVHDDGTVGVEAVDLDVDAGALVLLTGQVGSGKSSLLAGLAGLVGHEGTVRWNGRAVDDPESFLRPGQVAYVAQLPRVLSGSFADNITLGHRRAVGDAIADARLGPDVDAAGGTTAVVGHRGIRLSGGQVQRLAMARALATGAELIVADDVSSALDVRTEIELWSALRTRGTTVVGASSKRAALDRADRVVVLEDGRVADQGTWRELSARWSHLAG